jgi:multidrug efflux pump subunit AcrA (membrane-fusion protein)
MNLFSGLFTRSKGMVRRMVTVEQAATEYEQALADADAAKQQATAEAQARYDQAAAAAAEAVRRAEQAQADATRLAAQRHIADREQALATLDEQLKVATGAHPDAFLRTRADGVLEVRTDDFGRAVVTAGATRDSWWVVAPGDGRAFYGSFIQARTAMWTGCKPAAREPVR